MQLELHFQDGFSGETIETLVDGEVRARFQAKTKYQINLAHVEQMTLEPGQKLAVRSADSGKTVEVPVISSKEYYIISKSHEQLLVSATDQMPRYL